MTLRNGMKWKLVLATAFSMGILLSVEAATPSRAVLITSQGNKPGENALLILDPASRQVVARIPLSGQPHNIAISADRKFAYTSNAIRGTDAENFPGLTRNADDATPLPSDTISVVDLDAKKEVRVAKIGAGVNPHGIYFAAGKVYFTTEGSKSVGRYDPTHNLVDWTGGIGQNRVHELVVTRDGSRIFTTNIGSDNVAMVAPWDPAVDAMTGKNPPPWNVTLIPAGKGAEGIAITPDEKEVWIANGAAGTATVIDVASRKNVATVDLKMESPLRITITPDGKRAVVTGVGGDVSVLDTKARQVIKVIPKVGTDSHGVVVTSDSAWAYVVAQGEAEIAVIDLKTLAVTDRIPTGTGKKPFDGMDGIALLERK